MKAFKKLGKAKVSILGRGVPAFALALAILVVPVAALLTTYVQVSGTAQIKQSLTLNAIESTFKYDILPYTNLSDTQNPNGVTSFQWTLPANNQPPGGFAVGGDEQDVGLLLSNYAEIPVNADIEVQTAGPANSTLYQNCIDVTIAFYNSYTPSNDPTCNAIGNDSVTCLATIGCDFDFTGNQCVGDEKCTGSVVASACNSTTDITSTSVPISVQQRPDIQDPATPFEDWICVRHQWDIAAVPGSYAFDLSINPA